MGKAPAHPKPNPRGLFIHKKEEEKRLSGNANLQDFGILRPCHVAAGNLHVKGAGARGPYAEGVRPGTHAVLVHIGAAGGSQAHAAFVKEADLRHAGGGLDGSREGLIDLRGLVGLRADELDFIVGLNRYGCGANGDLYVQTGVNTVHINAQSTVALRAQGQSQGPGGSAVAIVLHFAGGDKAVTRFTDQVVKSTIPISDFRYFL